MRVGVISPIAWRTPSRAYGPWEQVASNVAEGLVARGHEVTLFATADSLTAGHLEAVAPAGYDEDAQVTPKAYEALHIAPPSCGGCPRSIWRPTSCTSASSGPTAAPSRWRMSGVASAGAPLSTCPRSTGRTS